MKTAPTTKSNQPGESAGQRAGGIRPHTARSFEHRSERRKIRAQLRRLNWALNEEDNIFT
jgi:hypothetical protein